MCRLYLHIVALLERLRLRCELYGRKLEHSYGPFSKQSSIHISRPLPSSQPLAHRKIQDYTATADICVDIYIADRQISIRMGQAFSCRGPSLVTKFTASDLPTLQPQSAYENDYASVLQSQLELTVLFGNIHDLLYASNLNQLA